MGIAEAVSRPKKKDNKDFYQTPYLATEALLKSYKFIDADHTILDPCEGAGAITKVLRKNKLYYFGMDKYPQLGSTMKQDFLEFKPDTLYDIIIANPPYSLKNEFIDYALEVANHVFMILPMQVVNYNHFHRKYLNRKEYLGRLLLTPKFFMNQEINEDYSLVKGGVSSYAWFHYSRRGRTGSYSYERYCDLGVLKKELEDE